MGIKRQRKPKAKVSRKKPKKPKKYNLKTRITSGLRKIWLYSPMRREAVKRAKDAGNFCENKQCGAWQERLDVDHIIPCASLEAWDGWDAYIDRMMVGSIGLICICSDCHKAKTSIQREIRKENKK